MNTLSSLLNWIGNTIGANPNTLATSSKTIVGSINETNETFDSRCDDAESRLTTLETKVDSIVATEHQLTATLTVNAGSSLNSDAIISKSGYYPLGIIGWRLINGAGSGGSYGVPFGIRLYNAGEGLASVYYGIRAVDGNVNTCTFYVTVLWIKKTV